MSLFGNCVLRCVYVSPQVDAALREEAFKRKISKNELIRVYVEAALAARPRTKTTVRVRREFSRPARRALSRLSSSRTPAAPRRPSLPKRQASSPRGAS